jgi:hypothetical protein
MGRGSNDRIGSFLASGDFSFDQTAFRTFERAFLRAVLARLDRYEHHARSAPGAAWAFDPGKQNICQ